MLFIITRASARKLFRFPAISRYALAKRSPMSARFRNPRLLTFQG